MFCGNCGSKNDDNFKFCDTCGAALVGAPQAATASPLPESNPVTPQAAPVSAPLDPPVQALSSLNLTSWAGLRWLLATNYGQLSITDQHLNHQIDKFWASNVYSVIVKIFSWGLDIFSSVFLSRGSTALKSITTVRIFALNWIVWKGHFLFIWSGGFPDIYFFSGKQINEVTGFVAGLKKAAAEAKYSIEK